jgi:flagellar protein FlaE
MNDPREYDPDELRQMAFDSEAPDGGRRPPSEFVGREPDGPLPGAGEALDSARERELLRLDASLGDVERPYLPELPEALAAEYTVFEWLDFLTRKAGLQRALRALEYYRSVGWIGASAEDRLQEYLVGMELDRPTSEDSRLGVEDHLLSLVYVGRLAAMCE